MLDVSVSYNRYRFLGNEFLTWLWFVIENDESLLRQTDPELVSLEIGNRVVLENRAHESIELITIKGDDAGLEEGLLALRKGAVATELNLAFKSGDLTWRFNLKGENLDLNGLKVPETGAVETREDVEGAVLERVYLIERAVKLVQTLFEKFVRLRTSNAWNQDVLPRMRQWIHS